MRPGAAMRPSASITRSAWEAESPGPIWAIVSPEMAMSAVSSRPEAGSITRARRIRREVIEREDTRARLGDEVRSRSAHRSFRGSGLERGICERRFVMDRDRIEGKIEQAKGKARGLWGKVTGKPEERVKGTI